MKKIILSLVLILTAIFQNIASAADYNSVDWDRAPHFNNTADFANYVRECAKNCQSSIPAIFDNGSFVEAGEVIKIYKNTNAASCTRWTNNRDRSVRVLYELNVYPGARVEYAYRTGNTSILTNEERKLYNIAVEIVREAKRQPNSLLKEYYIHEKITERVTYYNLQGGSETSRHLTAIGALIDGKANCQGYTDAFYMLGRMAGLNVGRMSGNAAGGPHAWNTIEFGDGRYYGVDVTFDDASFRFAGSGEYNNYIYFNAPLEIMTATHSWEAAYNPAIYPKIDSRYFYCTPEFQKSDGKYFAFHSKTAEDALGYIAQRIAKQGYRLSWGMAPYNSKYANLNFSIDRLTKEILPRRYSWYGQIKMSVVHRGNWLFYIVDATKS